MQLIKFLFYYSCLGSWETNERNLFIQGGLYFFSDKINEDANELGMSLAND